MLATNYLSIIVNLAGNLAYYQPATQSATYQQDDFDYGAALAVDYNPTGTYSYTSTTSGTPAWWQVDLGALASVQNIRLLQSAVCCSAYGKI